MNNGLRRGALYGFIAVANALVGLMLFLVLTPPPTFAEAPDIIIKSRIIPARPMVVSGTPKRLVVPSLGIDVKIATGAYDRNTNSWTLSDTKAYFANVSVPANNINGTTLIYGHAKPAVFEALPNVASNARVQLYAADHVFIYRLTSKKEVTPTEIGVFTEKGPPRLVLQTCTGAWYQNRTLFTFKLIEVKTA